MFWRCKRKKQRNISQYLKKNENLDMKLIAIKLKKQFETNYFKNYLNFNGNMSKISKLAVWTEHTYIEN